MSAAALPLCRADAVALGEMTRVDVPGIGAVCVYHTERGYFASEDACTHGLASLSEGFIDGEVVHCPYHGGAFAIASGRPVLEPCTEPLRVYRVERRGPELLIAGEHGAP
jgi:nitrite reductase/ring-hydroxylating ferredoxin subunit